MKDKRSCIIIGKGPSLKRVTADYVDSFDDIIICNSPRYEGYEHILPLRATYQFRNNSTPNFTKEAVEALGLKGIFSTTKIGQKLHCDTPEHTVPVHYSEDYMPSLVQENEDNMALIYGGNNKVNPTTGVIAFSWAVNSGLYSHIAAVGFDMMQVGEDCYYFKPEEYQENLKYLLGKEYTVDGKRKYVSGHNPTKIIEYFQYELLRHKDTNFSFVSDSSEFIEKAAHLQHVIFIMSHL
tara:strand:- start:491 stop:1204 length:714 start_codon:yes stop_codon:yes gene_type:complete